MSSFQLSLNKIILLKKNASRRLLSFDTSKIPFNKIMAANRGEIATRIMRAGTELGCKTVGIFSHEDRYQQHRYKADQAFQVGLGKSPVGAYLDIASIIDVAVAHDVQAIHPGYGFLSENTHFAQACADNGIVFVGPSAEQLAMFGDKTAARILALKCKVPVVPGTDSFVSNYEDVRISLIFLFLRFLTNSVGKGLYRQWCGLSCYY